MKTFSITIIGLLLAFGKLSALDTLVFKNGNVIPAIVIRLGYEDAEFTYLSDSTSIVRISKKSIERIFLADSSRFSVEALVLWGLATPEMVSEYNQHQKKKKQNRQMTSLVIISSALVLTAFIISSIANGDYINY